MICKTFRIWYIDGMKTVTLERVAAKAGVSRATVSRVMNNHLTVDPETAEKVLRIARELGYRLSPREGRRNIGVLYQSLGFGNYLAMAFGALQRELFRRGYRLELVSLHNIELLNERVLSGVIDLSHDFLLNDRWEALSGLPLVRYYCPGRSRCRIGAVVEDGAECFRKLVAYLAGLGHRRIGFVSDLTEATERQRTARYLDGFVEGMHRLGEFAPERFMLFADAGSLDRLLAEGVTALIATNEGYGPRLAAELQERGVRIPEELSLITHEYDGISEFLRPKHTTYVTDYEGMAIRAIDLLERLMAGEMPPEKAIPIPYGFIERASTAYLN